MGHPKTAQVKASYASCQNCQTKTSQKVVHLQHHPLNTTFYGLLKPYPTQVVLLEPKNTKKPRQTTQISLAHLQQASN